MWMKMKQLTGWDNEYFKGLDIYAKGHDHWMLEVQTLIELALDLFDYFS